MPIYYDKSRKRWRYEFSRIVNGQRQRTILSPSSTLRTGHQMAIYLGSHALDARFVWDVWQILPTQF